MIRRTRWSIAMLAALLCPGCAWRSPWTRATPAPDAASGAVALVTEGSAFERPGLRDHVARALARTSGRRVVVLETLSTVNDAEVKSLAARVNAANRSLGSYDWREPRCRVDAPVLTALVHGVEGVYRVRLDRRERLRPATPAEAAERTGVTGALRGMVRSTARGMVREESGEGSVALWGFGERGPTRQLPVSRTVSHLEPSVFTARLDAGRVAADALAALPPLEKPAWEALARRLVAADCPFLALAVRETRLGPHERQVRSAALAAIRRRPGRARAKAPAAEPTPAPVEPPRTDERYSCTNLCGMHMVEMCNKDKSLWSTHRKPWEATPCGTMRDDAFLKECYRQQWLSGAFHDACVRPCESTPEGRDRLLDILQSEGCVRLRSS